MSTLEATVNPIVIDNTATPPATSGTTEIRYRKDPPEEYWTIRSGAGWVEENVHLLTGQGDEADFAGEYDITLAPGQSYRVGIFTQNQGPLSTDPHPQADLTVFGVLKKPDVPTLITSIDENTGGTWHRHAVNTNVATSVTVVGASRTPPTHDGDGIPSLVDPDGVLASPPPISSNHILDLLPLVPGNHYFFTVMVVDAVGNWEVRESTFDTLRRKLMIKFTTMHIYNDGDPGSYGEGEFWFRVLAGSDARPLHTLEEFHLPEMDIDDWSETDRPYPVGFAYVELEPQTIPPDRASIWVDSRAIEYDGLDADEAAGSLRGRNLGLPVGPSEKVTNNTILMDCPTTTVDDDFHYGVDVIYSVEYLP